MGINRTDCFAYYNTPLGSAKCSALLKANCNGCKFYKSKEDYYKYVKPLKHKK